MNNQAKLTVFLLTLSCAMLASGAPQLPKAARRQRPPSPNNDVRQPWHLLSKQKLVSVEVERMLYRSTEFPETFVHLRIRNLSTRTIGVDNKGLWQTLCVNQVTVGQQPRRIVIDELLPTLPPIDEVWRKSLLEDYAGKRLKMIDAGQTADAYITVPPYMGLKKVKEGKGYFCILTMAGRLISTDGVRIEEILRQWPEFSMYEEVVLPCPLRWKPVPATADMMLAMQEARKNHLPYELGPRPHPTEALRDGPAVPPIAE